MPTRHYFRKAVAPPHKPPTPPAPDHHRKVVLAKKVVAGSKPQFKGMRARDAASQIGRRKGALTTHARGKAHRWDSESARKAAQKLWRTRFRKVRGIRIGWPAHRAERLDRVAIRIVYQDRTAQPIWFDSTLRQWWRQVGQIRYPISENAALRALGFLKDTKGWVPDAILVTHLAKEPRNRRKGTFWRT